MSTTIEFNRLAIELPDGEYLYFIKHGDNNMFHKDWQTGSERIAKSWTFQTKGTREEVVEYMTPMAEQTEGGIYRYQNGSTTPENFLKNVKKAIRNAVPLEDFKNSDDWEGYRIEIADRYGERGSPEIYTEPTELPEEAQGYGLQEVFDDINNPRIIPRSEWKFYGGK